jgi:glycosyltransferase involved in cell wall biosynthesis
MRILMLLDAPFPPDVRVEKEIRTLVSAGHEVHLLCYRHRKSIPAEESYNGAMIHRWYVPAWAAPKMLGLFFHVPLYVNLWAFQLNKTLRAIRPDAVHVHDLPLGVPTAMILTLWGVIRPRFVLDLHEDFPRMLQHSRMGTAFPQKLLFRYSKWSSLEANQLTKADSVIAVSEGEALRLKNEHGFTGQIHVVPNYVSVEFFRDVRPTEETKAYFKGDRVNILYVGGLNPTYGLQTVISGLAEASELHPLINVVIVGSGSLRRELEAQTERLGLSSLVTFVGHVPMRRVGEFCQCADLCLMPVVKSTHTESVEPNKLYEYALFGKPVLAAGTTSLRKRIEEMECGMIYEPDDPSSFAEVLRDMLSDRQRMLRFGARARESVLKKYNWETAAKPLLRLYGD